MENSTLILSHYSAYQFWMIQDGAADLALKHVRGDVVGVRVSAHPAAYQALNDDARFTRPLHFCVAEKDCSRGGPNVVYHVQPTDISASEFFCIAPGARVCAPWLCLTQLTSCGSLPQVAFFAMGLAGRYKFAPGSSNLEERSAALATIAALSKKITAHSYLRGTRLALRALQYAADGSRSPMETRAYLLFSLPYKYGGFGLPAPVLNQEILPGFLRPIVNQSRFEGDLCWPDQKVIVEYNGKDYHTDFAKDAARFGDLEALGWKVFYLNREIINNPRAFERVALEVARCLGRRVRRPEGWAEKHAALRKTLGLRA